MAALALACCLLSLALGLVPEALAKKQSSRYDAALANLRSLSADARKGGDRKAWEKAASDFLEVYRANPTGPDAPKALYCLGRVHEELGSRFRQRGDDLKAIDYYQRVESRFPRSSLADDSLLRKALIARDRLGQPDRAYADLLLVTHNYPKGDMASEARTQLAQMDKARLAASAPPAPKSPPASQPESAQPAPQAEADISGEPAQASGEAAQEGAAACLDSVRYHASKDYTRVVLDFDRETRYSSRLIPPGKGEGDTYRLGLELKGTTIGQKVETRQKVSGASISSIQVADAGKGCTNVVLDLGRIKDYKVFSLFDPYRVVVDVYAQDAAAAEVLPAVAEAPEPPAARSKSAKSGKPGKAAKTEPNLPPPGSKEQAGDLVEQLGLTVRTIMIDAGHGGKDPGAIANGVNEKDVVLSVAKRLGKKLEAKGYKVIYTRTTDVFVPLEERTAMANLRKADLFVSLHCNWYKDAGTSGLESYYLNLARSSDAVRVAARENSVSSKRISDLQVILTDLMLNSKVKESKDLAGLFQKNVVATARGKKYRVEDKGVREAPFYVLMGAKMPAVLVELGYISNRSEARRLTASSYQDILADGLAGAIQSYRQRIERFASR